MALDSDDIHIATAERIFADHADLQAVAHDRAGNYKAALWQAVVDNGLTLAMLPEASGGVGLSLDQAFDLLRAAGRWGISVPLADTMLAGWALAAAGLEPREGKLLPLVPAPRGKLSIDAAGRVTGRCAEVAFGREAEAFVALCDGPDGPVIALLDPSICQIVEGTSLAFEPLDAVSVDGVAVSSAPAGGAVTLPEMAATARANQIAGALETMLDISVAYAIERKAFERTISKFQAVQHLLALLGEECAAAVAAAVSAGDTLARGDSGPALLLEVAAAKVRCGEAAEQASAIAHQVHGAIGFTAEHPLHRLTLNTLAWREDYGTEAHWALALGKHVSAGGADALWSLLSDR
ncbi:acyl-CoA dehydrogenase [Pseudooceanicola sp.]|uniref:acyl-CoA dehydrogenase n=1 Tax=Pseudooceanicola sp. TaxID=1914328 RepID=UPI002613D02E|nr:acyl-CoA dehydrogenase [Pseudooceanicola sp.]MDF1854062.1 acyl-CoA dehydrogenase [Pseudooceanicola sp.]